MNFNYKSRNIYRTRILLWSFYWLFTSIYAGSNYSGIANKRLKKRNFLPPSVEKPQSPNSDLSLLDVVLPRWMVNIKARDIDSVHVYWYVRVWICTQAYAYYTCLACHSANLRVRFFDFPWRSFHAFFRRDSHRPADARLLKLFVGFLFFVLNFSRSQPYFFSIKSRIIPENITSYL